MAAMSSSGPGRRWLVLLVLGVAIQAAARAEDLPQPPTISGFPPILRPAPQLPPRPATGPQSVGAFLDGITSNDAVFEVMVGQGRIMTFKENLAAAGKAPALIAVGDPSVLDFAVVSPRQI